jgi:hypothetical protein
MKGRWRNFERNVKGCELGSTAARKISRRSKLPFDTSPLLTWFSQRTCLAMRNSQRKNDSYCSFVRSEAKSLIFGARTALNLCLIANMPKK